MTHGLFHGLSVVSRRRVVALTRLSIFAHGAPNTDRSKLIGRVPMNVSQKTSFVVVLLVPVSAGYAGLGDAAKVINDITAVRLCRC